MIEHTLLIDVVIGFMIAEWVALSLYRLRRRCGLSPLALAILLAPGAVLLIAMRGVATGEDWRWTACFLAAAGVAHCADLVLRRYRTGGRGRVCR
jgi:hypothetical protein